MDIDHGMMNADTEERVEDALSFDPETPTRTARISQGARNAVGAARAGVATIARRAPGTARATRTAARRTTSALQRLPDSKLRWLTASSVGLAAGFKLAGAPRLVTAAGAAPAVFMGAAIALRRAEPAGPIEQTADESAAPGDDRDIVREPRQQEGA